MFFKQADIFWGMNKDFVAEIMKLATTESHAEGKTLFQVGSQASHFYVLIKGCVKLSIGEGGQVVHVVSKAGEAFGWSSLIGRNVYSASAECMNPTNLLKFDSQNLQSVLEKNSENGMIFFKRLAATLGNRLIQSYGMISSTVGEEAATSFGTGQVLSADAAEI